MLSRVSCLVVDVDREKVDSGGLVFVVFATHTDEVRWETSWGR